jgi:CDP-glucose 4,6-dehydratase
LAPAIDPSLFQVAEIGRLVESDIGDVRNLARLRASLCEFQPEIVLHLAAQPIVRESFLDPVGTFETNIMGTVNLLEAVRNCPSVRSVVNVTTDKVYRNLEWEWGYRETDVLDGFDPYSNSKSCSELVTGSYRNSFFADSGPVISTARAGNVIGGGDFAKDRILPDCVRATSRGESILVRNPYSTRPYQHVLEPLYAYLLLARRQIEDPLLAGSYNIGPDESDCITTGELTDHFCRAWGVPALWTNLSQGGPHEAGFLKLDCSKAKARLGWRPALNIAAAVEMSVAWYRTHLQGGRPAACMEEQIAVYEGMLSEGST